LVQVYAWGQNNAGQIGCGSTANQPTPKRVSAVIGNLKIVSITCGQNSSFALSENGDVSTKNLTDLLCVLNIVVGMFR